MHDEVNTAAEKKSQSKRAAASGWVGSTLEYYDFAIYGSGYVGRQLGAFILGKLGDRFGRRNILIAAMLMMGISTFLVGILPTYHQVGLLAPALLVVLRLIQGFAVAGELSGASAMIIE